MTRSEAIRMLLLTSRRKHVSQRRIDQCVRALRVLKCNASEARDVLMMLDVCDNDGVPHSRSIRIKWRRG